MPMVLMLLTWSLINPFNGWQTLQLLTLTSGYDEFLGESVELPLFSEELKQFDGQEVTIEGYVIPLKASGEQDYFVLSRFPFNNCFFCGNAGPETVIEVYTDQAIQVKDAKVEVTGVLELNDTDPLHLFFILSEAEVKFLQD
ncbi:MAG: hypothetical protein JXR10_15350 [Cyclobacteriaceae bacterium]